MVAVLAAVVGSVHVLVARVDCLDAARAGARAAARAETDPQVRSIAATFFPEAEPASVHRGDGLVRVTVEATVRVALPIPPVRMRCTAVGALEDVAVPGPAPLVGTP